MNSTSTSNVDLYHAPLDDSTKYNSAPALLSELCLNDLNSNQSLPPAADAIAAIEQGLHQLQSVLFQNEQFIFDAMDFKLNDFATVPSANTTAPNTVGDSLLADGELQATATQALDTHAEQLKQTFATPEAWQGFLADIFASNPEFQTMSTEQLADLQRAFVDGTLRPDVKFVDSDMLTDPQGNARGAAFDQNSQTILLADNLDSADIESSIAQELGHWWDGQLHGSKDTTTTDGNPFDEGTAYAERLLEGTQGDNIFSDLVYQPDIYTVKIAGEDTDVEFRNIATWNIQGATHNGTNTWENVFEVMNNPQGFLPIEVMAIQEAGNPRDALGLEPTAYHVDGRIVEYNIQRGGANFRIYWTLGGLGQNERHLATVLRNPSGPIYLHHFANPTNEDNRRPILGVVTGGNAYYNVHATRTGNSNDAEPILDHIYNNPQVNQIQQQYGGIDRNEIFVLGDFNRDIANGNDPVGGVDNAYGNQQWRDALIRHNGFTHNAREANPTRTLDYLFTEANLLDNDGTVLNNLPNARTGNFPSDHFPVAYDDEVSIAGEEIGVQILTPTPVTNRVTNTIGSGSEFTDLPASDSNPNDGLSPVDVNINVDGDGDIILEVDGTRSGTFANATFNGYHITDLDGGIPDFGRVFVNGRNDLGLTDSNITVVDSNTIAINVAGLDYAPGDRVELTTEFT